MLEASWSSAERLWSLRVEHVGSGEQEILRTRWIFSGTGYYRYDEGFTPKFEGRERYTGQVIHPQHWPRDLDWSGKRVVVIGSGATAVTLVPAMSRQAAHVTMLQRTPTYVLPVPSKDPLAERLRPLLGDRWTHAIARRANIAKQRWFFAVAQRYPNWTRNFIRKINVRVLPKDYPVDVHFNPPYAPWDQRLCAVPSADLFREITKGRASIVTDRIESFDETGIVLQSGQRLDSDIIVTATGLNLLPFGGIQVQVDGKAVRPAETVAFKGMMLSGVPNLAFAIGYTASSWTLKVGLLCEHFCRLLKHMDQHGLEVCTPVADAGMETLPLLNFGAGYVKRSLDELPRQGTHFPWAMTWNYFADAKLFRRGAVADKHLRFTPRRTSSADEQAGSRTVSA